MAVKKQKQVSQAEGNACREIERNVGKYIVKLRFAEQEVPGMLDTLLSMVMRAYAERQERFFR